MIIFFTLLCCYFCGNALVMVTLFYVYFLQISKKNIWKLKITNKAFEFSCSLSFLLSFSSNIRIVFDHLIIMSKYLHFFSTHCELKKCSDVKISNHFFEQFRVVCFRFLLLTFEKQQENRWNLKIRKNQMTSLNVVIEIRIFRRKIIFGIHSQLETLFENQGVYTTCLILT